MLSNNKYTIYLKDLLARRKVSLQRWLEEHNINSYGQFKDSKSALEDKMEAIICEQLELDIKKVLKDYVENLQYQLDNPFIAVERVNESSTKEEEPPLDPTIKAAIEIYEDETINSTEPAKFTKKKKTNKIPTSPNS